jgi:hypothetical protein
MRDILQYDMKIITLILKQGLLIFSWWYFFLRFKNYLWEQVSDFVQVFSVFGVL